MKHFKVKVYVATEWSFLTKADYFEVHEFDSDESLEQIANQLASHGFRSGNKWIMPGAILEIEET